MTATRPPDDTDRPDEIKQRYLEASAEQDIGPSERVKLAALAHAQTVAFAAGEAARSTTQTTATPAPLPAAAANQSRWNVPLVASLAIASISALLALQFDRSDPADQQIVPSTPSATTPAGTATLALPSQESRALPSQESQALQRQDSLALPKQEKLDLPAPKKSATVPAAAPSTAPSPPPVAKKAKPAEASASPPAAPTPAAAAEPAYVAEPLPRSPLTSPRLTPPVDAALPAGRNTAAVKPPAAAAELADGDKSAKSSATGAVQSKAAPSADAEQGAQAGGRSDARSAGTSAARKDRAAAAAPPSPSTSPSSSPALAPASSTAASPATSPALASSSAREAAPLEAGLALREAARTGQLTALIEALQSINAAQLNSTDGAGRTALMLAALGGHVELVQRLVAAGADTELKDTSGQTAAQMARRLGYQQIEAALKKR